MESVTELILFNRDSTVHGLTVQYPVRTASNAGENNHELSGSVSQLWQRQCSAGRAEGEQRWNDRGSGQKSCSGNNRPHIMALIPC